MYLLYTVQAMCWCLRPEWRSRRLVFSDSTKVGAFSDLPSKLPRPQTTLSSRFLRNSHLSPHSLFPLFQNNKNIWKDCAQHKKTKSLPSKSPNPKPLFSRSSPFHCSYVKNKQKKNLSFHVSNPGTFGIRFEMKDIFFNSKQIHQQQTRIEEDLNLEVSSLSFFIISIWIFICWWWKFSIWTLWFCEKKIWVLGVLLF